MVKWEVRPAFFPRNIAVSPNSFPDLGVHIAINIYLFNLRVSQDYVPPWARRTFLQTSSWLANRHPHSQKEDREKNKENKRGWLSKRFSNSLSERPTQLVSFGDSKTFAELVEGVFPIPPPSPMHPIVASPHQHCEFLLTFKPIQNRIKSDLMLQVKTSISIIPPFRREVSKK